MILNLIGIKIFLLLVNMSIFRVICFELKLSLLSNVLLKKFAFEYFDVDVISTGNGAFDIVVIASTTPSFKFSPI